MGDTGKIRIGWLVVAVIAVLIVAAGVFVLPGLLPDRATSFRPAPSGTGTYRAAPAVTQPMAPTSSSSVTPSQASTPAAAPSATFPAPAPQFTRVEVPVPTYSPPTYRFSLLPPRGSSCTIIDQTIARIYLGSAAHQLSSTSSSTAKVDGCTWQSAKGTLTYSLSDLDSPEVAAAVFASNKSLGQRPESVAFSPQLGDASAGFSANVQGVGDTTLTVVKGQYVLFVALSGMLDSRTGAIGAVKYLLGFTP